VYVARFYRGSLLAIALRFSTYPCAVPDPRCLDLAIRQVKGHVGLVNMPDPRCLDFAFSHVQGNDHPLLACLGK